MERGVRYSMKGVCIPGGLTSTPGRNFTASLFGVASVRMKSVRRCCWLGSRGRNGEEDCCDQPSVRSREVAGVGIDDRLLLWVVGMAGTDEPTLIPPPRAAGRDRVRIRAPALSNFPAIDVVLAGV